MILHLTRRTLLRLWPILAVTCAVLMAIGYLFVALLQPLGRANIIQTLLQFAPRIGDFLGAGEIDPTTSAGLASVAYVHPLPAVLMLVWILAVTSTTLGGDLESGEAELLLSRAVPRRAMAFSALLALLAGAVAMPFALWCGTMLGGLVNPPEAAGGEPGLSPLRFFGAASVNSALILAMGCVALFVSALSSDRGPVLAIGAGLWVLNYFCGAVAPIFESLGWLRGWSLHGHARPQMVIAHGELPWTDLGILVAVAALSFGVALWVWSRRDLAR